MRRYILWLAVTFIAVPAGGCSSEKPGPRNPEKTVAGPEITDGPTAATAAEPAKPAAETTSSPAEDRSARAAVVATSELPQDLLALFKKLDELGREQVKDAKFVKATFRNAQAPTSETSEDAWLVAEDDGTVTLLKDDLSPWVYNKKSATTIPASWHPAVVNLTSVNESDFESRCKTMSEGEKEPADEEERMRRRFRALRGPGPSHRLLIAHAAWKKGLSQNAERIIAADPAFAEDKEKYVQSVLDDLGWLHFLRGVNLLMFADRKEALVQLRLASKLAPQREFGTDVNDLINRLEKLIAAEQQPEEINAAGRTESERAELYVSQLKDLNCAQMSQPGFIEPFFAVVNGKPDMNPASKRLLDLKMASLPALLKALEDDTPTRTVYHWRDFDRKRIVWRVSDFAWTILRGITQKEFGYQRVVGFTFSSMTPAQKQRQIAEIKKWYADSKDLSPDDRMLGFFKSEQPDDWMKAGEYFLKKNDKRAVAPLLEKISGARQFNRGDLCELVAKFGDSTAVPVMVDVLKTAEEPSDRVSAAIALWQLGDASGIPVVIEYVKAEQQPYGSWDTPVWFLMRSHTPEGIETLKSVILDGPVQRAAEVLQFIGVAITGDLWSKKMEPAACVEICPLLIAAMNRAEFTGATINDVKTRFKDSAAKSLAVMRQGWNARFGGRFVQVDPKLFNESEPDEAKRDEQIEALRQWYEDNKDKLVWDSKARKLAIKTRE